MNKMLSGRFLLTLTAGVVWSYLAYTGQLNGEFNAGLISTIVTFYFMRNDRRPGG